MIGKKKNILVVDDSALMRRVICDIINSDDRFEVADIAKDGLEALKFLTDKQYAVVVLDINMPKMTGLELLSNMQKFKIKANVVMNSTLTKEGAKETILALELGAIDFVTKPENFIEAKGNDFKTRLLSAVAVAARVQIARSRTVMPETGTPPVKPAVRRREQTAVPSRGNNRIIALACSTGGPKSLQEVVPVLPKTLPIPMLIVQHMPAGFTRSLAERLNEISKVKVKEAEEGDVLQAGTVYIAPGGKHMRVMKSGGSHKIRLMDGPPREGVKPCANYMYESLAESSYDEIVCVVLTGMGADGTKGIKALDKAKKTYVIAQDEASSVVYGMPKAIAETGLVDRVVPLNQITDTIMKNMGVQ